MKGITLYQPWPTLIALGVKHIETRPRGTTYRGPLLIHAAKKPPEVGLEVGAWIVERGMAGGRPKFWIRERLSMGNVDDGRGRCVPLPLGAVVARSVLAEVLPMIGYHDPGPDWLNDFLNLEPDRELVVFRDRTSAEVVSDQWPYGGFSPGRQGWMLADVEAVDPVTEYPCPKCRPEWGQPASAPPDPLCEECEGTGMKPVRGAQATPWPADRNLLLEVASRPVATL